MRKSGAILLLLGTFLISADSYAQGPPPPPPPLIYVAPSASEMVKFTPSDGSFEVEFPGTPVETVQKLSEATITSFRVKGKGSNSVVAITAIPTANNLASQSNTVWGAIRDNLSRHPRTAIVKETDIELNGFMGREFEVNYGLEYGIVRVYLVGSRLIELQSDVTNWHIIGDKTKLEWRKETARFFNSFKIFK